MELKIVKLIKEGSIEREKHFLHMKEYEVEIMSGEPVVPQKINTVTQYQKWQWAEPNILIDAVQKGSLCSRLFLNNKK